MNTRSLKPTNKDYQSYCGFFGGNLEDIRPRPHIRKFPHKGLKRKVRVTVQKYDGIGMHYYATLAEEDNPVWNGEERRWQKCWGDTQGRGRYLMGRCNTAAEAEQFIEKSKKKHFSEDTHILISEHFGDDDKPKKWHYKDGD